MPRALPPAAFAGALAFASAEVFPLFPLPFDFALALDLSLACGLPVAGLALL